MVQAPVPFLWFDTQAEDAAKLYTSIFKNSNIGSVARYPDGRAMVVNFELDGQKVIALNGGPMHKLTDAFSLSVSCDTQEEIDELWNVLIADGGAPGRCGWLKDRFGLSWQVIPKQLGKLISTPKGVQAMMQMSKIEIAVLEAASQS